MQEVLLRLGVHPLQDLVAVGESAEALDHRDVSVKDFMEDIQRIVRRELFHHPFPLLHAQKLVVQHLGVGQHQAEEDPLHRAQTSVHAHPQPPLHQPLTARVTGIHLGRVTVDVAGELVEHDHQRHQQARVLDIQGPVVVLPGGRQCHGRAEPIQDVLVRLLGLAEPQGQALFDIRPQHVLQDLVGLVDLRRRDLDAIDLEQHAQLMPESLQVRSRECVAPFQAGEDHDQALLDALAEQLGRRDGEQIVHLAQLPHEAPHIDDRPWRIVLHQGDELVVRGRDAFGIGHRLDRGGSRAGLDQAHFAEHVARAQRRDGLGFRLPADADLDRARDDEECGVAVFPLGNNRIPGPEFDGLH